MDNKRQKVSVSQKPRAESSVEPSTGLLMNEIKSVQNIDEFLEKNKNAFYISSIDEHFNMLLKKYCVNKNEAIERADIERGYGYQILRGARDTVRDKYIRLAIGIGLDLDDTQRLLTIVQKGILYPKVLRDAIIIFAINSRFNLISLQLLLDQQGYEPLE